MMPSRLRHLPAHPPAAGRDCKAIGGAGADPGAAGAGHTGRARWMCGPLALVLSAMITMQVRGALPAPMSAPPQALLAGANLDDDDHERGPQALTAGGPALPATGTPRSATAPSIGWHSGPRALPRDGRPAAAVLTELSARPNARHLVVQFRSTPDAQQRAALKAAGVTLLHYLGNHAYFAAVAPERLNAAALTQAAPLEAAAEILPAWKLHSGFAAGQTPAWTAAQIGQTPATAALVLLHPDVPLEPDGVATVRRHGAKVRSLLHTVNGLVIELPRAQLAALVAEDAVQWVEPPLPAFSEVNDSNRVLTEAEEAQAAPYGLSGAGVTVLVYDGGAAEEMHPDYGGRLTSRDGDTLSNHATHVAGTIGGDGVSSSGQYRGMAPAVQLESYGFDRSDPDLIFLYEDPGDLERDYSHAVHVFGADVANNSIGTNTCRNGFDCHITGDYGVTASVIDAIVHGALGEPFRIVWAAGNERSCSRCRLQGVTTPDGYHSTAPPACAKNQIGVGALNSDDDSITDFTSWGPCDDGRLKPDISAPGCQSNDDEGVTSCCYVSEPGFPACTEDDPDNCCADDDGDGYGYTVFCGTSMATPTVTGLVALLLEDFRVHFPGQRDPRNCRLKALLAHNASDVGQPGPDYRSGYGSVRITQTIEFLRSGRHLEAVIHQSGAEQFFVDVTDPSEPLKVTLAWDDPQGTPNVAHALVNDLDLVVLDPQGVRHYPWTLNPAQPSAAALRTQEDHTNNIEQVQVDAPAPGRWTVRVVGHDVSSDFQVFALAASPQLAPDCNGNDIPDGQDLADGTAQDCTANGVLDECEPDCDGNGVADSCDVASGGGTDCNGNGVLDGCPKDPFEDCNRNDVQDSCDVAAGRSDDCNRNWIPDECEDCNGTRLADECDIALGDSKDCNLNRRPDECDLVLKTSLDCNTNAIPDECEIDCNDNVVPDDCDIAVGTSLDCNGSNVPDECELVNENSPDCNKNASPDECDIAAGTPDCNEDGIPDECQLDCNANRILDTCDVLYGASPDADGNGVPDECLHILRVPSEFPTIQAAIDAAAEGDTILLADGVYTGPGNKEIDFGTKNVTVRSENGPARCIIDVEHAGRGFYIHGGQNATSLIDGLTIRHGLVATGAGIYITNSSPRIHNCIVTDNRAVEYGGGIQAEHSDVQIRNCQITRNTGSYFSGGLGLALGSPVVENCLIAGNASDSGLFGSGAGLYIFEADAIIANCLITGNRAFFHGGGVYLWETTTVLRNCTIVANQAGAAGAGVSCWLRSAPRLASCIVRNNVAPSGAELHLTNDSVLTVAYSNVAGGEAAALIESGALDWQKGNIDAGAGFVAPQGPDGQELTWEDNDYHLLPSSPCIDAGEPQISLAVGPLDADGQPRRLGGRVDMGSDEFPADCDQNGVADYLQIAAGQAADCNANLVPDACDLAAGHADRNQNQVPDECECAFNVPPALDHSRLCAGGPHQPFLFDRAIVHSGYIDPRRGTFDGVTPQLGLDAVTLIFTEPVYDAGSTAGGTQTGVLTPAGFEVLQTAGAPPRVTKVLVDPLDPTRVRLEFDRIISWQEWTTIIARVEDVCGHPAVDAGNQGPGANESDRVDIGFLPGDIDQNGKVQPLDLLRFRQIINQHFAIGCLEPRMYVDIDRNGMFQPLDLLRYRQAVIPLWSGRTMNQPQP